MRELRRVLTCALALAAVAPATAAAHVVVQPSQGRPADPQVYTVTVPNESDAPVVDVRLKVPEGVDFLLIEAPPAGWKGRLVRSGDAIGEVRWSGGEIPVEGFATFRFLMRNPVEEGEITWPVVQRYANGEVQRWIGPPDSETPASRTRISEGATPTNVVSVKGEKAAAAAPGAPAPLRAAPADERDALTFGLAIAGAALGAAALALSLLRRRPA